MNDLLVEQLKSLLDDEANETSYLVEEVEQGKEEETSTGTYKDAASMSAPAGHKWVYVFAVNSETLQRQLLKLHEKFSINQLQHAMFLYHLINL